MVSIANITGFKNNLKKRKHHNIHTKAFLYPEETILFVSIKDKQLSTGSNQSESSLKNFLKILNCQRYKTGLPYTDWKNRHNWSKVGMRNAALTVSNCHHRSLQNIWKCLFCSFFSFFLCHMISLKFLLGIYWGGFDYVSFADFLVKFSHNSFSIIFSLGCNFTFVLDTKTIIWQQIILKPAIVAG